MMEEGPLFKSFQTKFKKDIFPSDWVNPKPKTEYDLVVLGGGPGGMTGASLASSLGARVALVEKKHLGGECLSYGCIPSKAFLSSCRLSEEIRNASDYGLEIPQGWSVNFKKIMQRVYDLQTTLSPYDSAVQMKNLGVDVFLGAGRFTAPNALQVGTETLHFKKAIISTGTEPILLNVPGLEPSDYFTNQNIFSIASLPTRLCVIGGGPISCELSQGFLNLGSQVTLVTHGSRLLSKDDLMAADILKNQFEKQGMRVLTQSNLIRAEKKGNEKILYFDSQKEPLVVDEILVGIGRKPVVEGLDLEQAKVSYDKKAGIAVNEYLQTSNLDIYAAGDVASAYKFTHMSVAFNKMAATNAIKGNTEKHHSLIVPWCTFTDPEIAHIGINENEAKKQGISVETALVEMKNVDRALLDGETLGYVKLIVKENSDQIVGGTIMAKHAGDMISELGAAMNGENGLRVLLKTIHPFPTQASVLQSAAEEIIKKRKAMVHA